MKINEKNSNFLRLINRKSFKKEVHTFFSSKNGIYHRSINQNPIVKERSVMKMSKTLSLIVSSAILTSFITVPDADAVTGSSAAKEASVSYAADTEAVTTINGTINYPKATATIAGGDTFALLTSSCNVQVGETVTISKCGTAVPDSWSVDNEDVISLDSTGLKAMGLKEGTAVITYTSKGIKQKAAVNVTDGGSKSFTDKVAYTAGMFVFFAENGVYKIDPKVILPDSSAFTAGNTVKAEFEYKVVDDMRTITAVNKAEVLSSEEMPLDMPLSAEFTDTVEAVDLNYVQFRDHGGYYLNTDYALIYSKEFTRLEAGEECTASFMYRDYADTKVIINVDKLDSSETGVCSNCGKEVPRNHIITTSFGQKVCDDCNDHGWCGDVVENEFTDLVTAKYGQYIRFRTHGRYSTADAEGADMLDDIKVGDTVSIKFESVSTYEAKMLKINELNVISNTSAVTTLPNTATDVKTTTTTAEPEVWMYGTGVDHFGSIKTLPTKTIYDAGEELDLSGLVINSYHSVARHSNKGNSDYLRTDYEWEVEKIAPEYITISDFTGKTYTADEFPTLPGGSAYTVKLGKAGASAIALSVKGDQYEKELYGVNDFTFRVYINSDKDSSKFIRIDNAEVESFGYGTTSHGFKLKGMDEFSIDMDAHMHAGYAIEDDIRKGDTVSGVLEINPKSNYIYLGDLEIVKYSGETGDANSDGTVDIADAVMIMQALANPNKYGLNGTDARCIKKRGKSLADMNGDGITVLDAQLIQNRLLGL